MTTDPDRWITGRATGEDGFMRLTGEHPLNGETQLAQLGAAGLITPTKLHYVRNHGRVPRLDPDKHVVRVDGLLGKSRQFSVADLQCLPQVRVAVTLTCDGNRRKELNMLKHTLGFNWGAGATSCSWCTGVLVRTILEECGGVTGSAKFVLFWGNEGEELAHGIYGTSLPIAVVLSSYSDIMVAIAMNDVPLAPDHGAPMRLLVPGNVGGRSVKWLSRIEVSAEASSSRYHREDNLVLPASVTSFAEVRNYFGKPEYVLYELNVNSVIFAPAHCEWIDTAEADEPYVVRGYAYSGGGRRVTRVEVTFNRGTTWDLAEIAYSEGSIRHDLFVYSWCHWSLKVPRWKFLTTEEIACRAVDSALNTQPESPIWNPHGMMNNCWYKVRIASDGGVFPSLRNRTVFPRFSQHGHGRYANEVPIDSGRMEAHDMEAMSRGDAERRSRNRAVRDENALSVEPATGCYHPVVSGDLLGGWQQFEHHAPPTAHMHRAIEPACATSSWFAAEEVGKHNTEDDCWIVVDGFVVDVTPYLKEHPGGKYALLLSAGKDVTHLFFSIHAHDANEIMDRFIIGRVQTAVSSVSSVATHGAWMEAKLIEKREASHDTLWLLVECCVNMAAGQHVLVAADIEGEWVVRPYSPTRVTERQFELLVKVYDARPGIPAGRMSTWLRDAAQIGQRIHVKAPCGYIAWCNGSLSVYNDVFALKRFSFVAGGTGITPVFAVIKSVLESGDSTMQVRLLYSNKTAKDILLRKELQELSDACSDRFRMCHVITTPSPDDNLLQSDRVLVGRINRRMTEEVLFPPALDSVVMLCGPPGMMEAVMEVLEKTGFAQNGLLEF